MTHSDKPQAAGDMVMVPRELLKDAQEYIKSDAYSPQDEVERTPSAIICYARNFVAGLEAVLSSSPQPQSTPKFSEVLGDDGSIKRFIWKEQSSGNSAWVPLEKLSSSDFAALFYHTPQPQGVDGDNAGSVETPSSTLGLSAKAGQRNGPARFDTSTSSHTAQPQPSGDGPSVDDAIAAARGPVMSSFHCKIALDILANEVERLRSHPSPTGDEMRRALDPFAKEADAFVDWVQVPRRESDAT